MKSTQCNLYAARIERVVQHLESRLANEDAPAVSELAQVAAMSEFHFHRIFRLMTGETVGELVRRLRLARSLPRLAEDSQVSRAAGTSGYSTTQSYARALKAQAGITASAARADASVFAELSKALTRSRDAGYKVDRALSIDVISVEPFRLLAVRNVGAYEELNASYSQLFELVLSQVAEDEVAGIYGIPHDDPRFAPAAECRFDCALAVQNGGEARNGLFILQLGGGSYARIRHLGDYDLMPGTIDLLYLGAIGVLDQEIAPGPSFIHYLDDPEEVAVNELRADIYLPLELER